MKTRALEKTLLATVGAVALMLMSTGCNKAEADNKKENPTAPVPAKETTVPKSGTAVVSEPVKIGNPTPAEPAKAEATPQKSQPSKVVVTVDGKKFTQADLDKEMKMITDSPQFAQLPSMQQEMIRKQYEGKITERFINNTILTEAAAKKGIKITDDDIDKAIADIRAKMPPGASSLEDAVKEHGITMDELRKNIGSDLKIRKLIDGVLKDATNITDEAVAKYFNDNKEQFKHPEQVHARHILVKVAPNADEKTKAEKKAEIEGYRKQLLEHPEDFAKIAEAHSDCPSGKRAGGDLGTFGHGQMVAPFDKAAFSQKVNEIGPVITTQFGYHIVQVLEHKPAGEAKLSEVKDKIKQMLASQNGQKAVTDYLDKLKKDAKIIYGDQKK